MNDISQAFLLCWCYRAANTTTREQVKKKKDILLWKEKEAHTVKNLYTVNEDSSIIIYKSKHKQIGKKKHDYNIYKNNYLKLPKDEMSMFDLGYLGSREGLSCWTETSFYISKSRKTANLLYSKKSTTVIIQGRGL